MEGISLSTFLQILTNFAPLSLARSWDNVGLLIKPVNPQNVHSVLLTIDLTEDVMREALQKKVDVIISHHPPIFKSFKKISSTGWKDRIITTCIENKIAVYSPHTTWDALEGGLTDWLASCFDSESVTPIEPYNCLGPTNNISKFSISIYCPQEHTKLLDNQLHNQSCAGVMFRSQPDSNGKVKYDIICSMEELEVCMQGMEGCGCVYNVLERVSVPLKGHGAGRICKLKKPISLKNAVERVKKHLDMPHLRLALAVNKTKDSTIRSVAIVAGSGTKTLRGVVADLYLTGEMFHHDILDATHSNASVILINHSDSERGFLKKVVPLLEKRTQSKVKFIISQEDKDPIVTV